MGGTIIYIDGIELTQSFYDLISIPEGAKNGINDSWIQKNNVRLIQRSGFGSLIQDSDRKEEKETGIKKTFNESVKGFCKGSL